VVAVAIVVLAAIAGSGENDKTKSETSDTELNLTCYSPIPPSHAHNLFISFFERPQACMIHYPFDPPFPVYLLYSPGEHCYRDTIQQMLPYMYALFMGDDRSIEYDAFF